MHVSLSDPTAALTSDMSADLWNSAAAVLDTNWSHNHMVPSRRLYPHQWSWDAAFIAIGLAYVALPDNPRYLGPAPLAEIAVQVMRSIGPSGTNVDYVLELARVLRELGADDPHVFELAALLRVEQP